MLVRVRTAVFSRVDHVAVLWRPPCRSRAAARSRIHRWCRIAGQAQPCIDRYRTRAADDATDACLRYVNRLRKLIHRDTHRAQKFFGQDFAGGRVRYLTSHHELLSVIVDDFNIERVAGNEFKAHAMAIARLGRYCMHSSCSTLSRRTGSATYGFDSSHA
jgi:hypothetical protein